MTRKPGFRPVGRIKPGTSCRWTIRARADKRPIPRWRLPRRLCARTLTRKPGKSPRAMLPCANFVSVCRRLLTEPRTLILFPWNQIHGKPMNGMCSRCPNPPAPGQRYCLKCKAAYARKWRKTHKMTPDQKVKDRARAYANVYLRRGKIQRGPCKIPGCRRKAQMHHPDYKKPLLVEWICRAHHLELHGTEVQKKRQEHSLAIKAIVEKHFPKEP